VERVNRFCGVYRLDLWSLYTDFVVCRLCGMSTFCGAYVPCILHAQEVELGYLYLGVLEQ